MWNFGNKIDIFVRDGLLLLQGIGHIIGPFFESVDTQTQFGDVIVELQLPEFMCVVEQGTLDEDRKIMKPILQGFIPGKGEENNEYKPSICIRKCR